MFTPIKQYYPYVSPFDPCKPITCKFYSTTPNLYIPFQPANLPQYSPREALFRGTLWPAFYDPWYNPNEMKMRKEGSQ